MKRFLDRWSVNESEPSWGALIGAFAVFCLFLIAVYLWTLFAAAGLS